VAPARFRRAPARRRGALQEKVAAAGTGAVAATAAALSAAERSAAGARCNGERAGQGLPRAQGPAVVSTRSDDCRPRSRAGFAEQTEAAPAGLSITLSRALAGHGARCYWRRDRNWRWTIAPMNRPFPHGFWPPPTPRPRPPGAFVRLLRSSQREANGPVPAIRAEQPAPLKIQEGPLPSATARCELPLRTPPAGGGGDELSIQAEPGRPAAAP